MAKFFPDIEEIKNLRVEPTKGENFLLNFLSEHLKGDDFEVFFQAPWDGSFPDIVILRKNHGIFIIEVKDWNLDLYRLNNQYDWTCYVGRNEGVTVKSPLLQAKHYKNLFYDTYSRTLASMLLKSTKNYSLVSSAVFFYAADENKVRRFFNLSQDEPMIRDHIHLLTKDILERDGFNNIPNANFMFGSSISKFFTDEVYSELHRVLKPSEYSRLKSVDIHFSRQQNDLAVSKAGIGQKIKGPAGSGKTTVLAYRAVDAYKKTGKPVLILTFNITLCNYIRDCISAALENLPNIKGRKGNTMKNFIIKHFHVFIRNYRNQTGQLEKVEFDDKVKKNVSSYELDEAPIKYASIFVDETQDYERSWLETISNKLLAPGGEIVFFGDEDQNLYERDKMTSVAIPKVTGRWNILKGTYRLNSRIAELARDFQREFFNGSVENEIDPQGNLFDESNVSYFFLNSFDTNAIMNIFRALLSKGVSNDDICIMSHLVENVRLIDKALRDANFKTITTFETQEEYNFIINNVDEDKFKSELEKLRRVAKFGFNMESGRIKLSTIHSYKGWGIPTEILIIGNNKNSDDNFLNKEMLYTGLTRAIQSLIIVNINDTDYDEFFRTWMSNHRLQIGVI